MLKCRLNNDHLIMLVVKKICCALFIHERMKIAWVYQIFFHNDYLDPFSSDCSRERCQGFEINDIIVRYITQ